jgi:transposase InsO family protein
MAMLALPGNCYDNAICNCFNMALERGLLVRDRFKTQRDASLAVFAYFGLETAGARRITTKGIA